MSHIVLHHCTHHCLCLECSADFVTWPTMDYPTTPNSVITSSEHHFRKQQPLLCKWGAPCLCTSRPWVSLCLCMVYLWLLSVYFLYWRTGTVFLYVFLPSAWQMFLYTKEKIAFIVLLWRMVKLYEEIREKNLHIFEKNISSFLMSAFIFLFWCKYYFNEILFSPPS